MRASLPLTASVAQFLRYGKFLRNSGGSRGIALLAILVLASSTLSAATPRERIIWAEAGFAGRFAFGLFVADSDGRNERVLQAGTGPAYNPSFSFDGKWIIFTSERFGSADVFRVHPDGAGLERLTDSDSFDDQGALSPDGSKLAFVSTRAGGTANLFVLDLVTHQLRNITRNKSGNFRPAWSPDGKWIAFSSDRDMPRMRYLREWGTDWEIMHRTAIYIMRPDGSGLKRLTSLEGCAGSPRWSPDGKRLIFVQVADMDAMRRFRMQAQVVSMDVATGATQTHSDAKSYAVAPAYLGDGEIGYGRFDARTQQVGAIAYSSGREGPAGAENPAWSPDGSLVAFDRRMPREPGWMQTRRAVDPRYEFVGGRAFLQETVSFTRSGDQFVYRPQGVQQLQLTDWSGNGPVLLDGRDNDRRIGRAAVSPDGRTLAVGIWNSAVPEEVGQIAVLSTSGTGWRIMTRDDARADYPSFSPDGSQLVYQLGKFDERGSKEHGLRLLSLADGRIVKLTNGLDSTPVWSPTGDRIAFTSWDSGDFEICTIRPDGTGLRQLTRAGGNDAHPVWSPDGRWIAFVSSRMGWKDEGLLPGHGPQTYGEIFVMRADGSDVRQLTDNQWEEGTIAWPQAARREIPSKAVQGNDR